MKLCFWDMNSLSNYRYKDYNLIRFVNIRLIIDAQIKIFIKPKSTKLKSIEDQKFQTIVPNTAKVSYAWDKKTI